MKGGDTMNRLTCPEYEVLKERFISGWKTWNVHNVLSFVHMPEGLSLNLCVKEYASGNFLREALIGRFPADDPEDATEILLPGDHAADDSYTCMTVRWCQMELLVETAADEEWFAVLITPVKLQRKPPMLCLQGGYLWNRPGTVLLDGNVLTARSGGSYPQEWTVYAGTVPNHSDCNVPLTGPHLSVGLTGQTGFLACRGEALPERCGSLKMRFSRLSKSVKNSSPMIRSFNHHRVISPVSRLWSIRKGGYVLFCWDNFFAGYLAAGSSRALAYSNVIEILNERTEKGFVPNMSCGNGQKTLDRSQPPVGSRMILELYHRFHDRWLVELCYPALLEWNSWFDRSRRSPEGALCWGSDPAPVIFGNRWELDGVNERFGGALESGLDNSPMYDDIPFDAEELKQTKPDDLIRYRSIFTDVINNVNTLCCLFLIFVQRLNRFSFFRLQTIFLLVQTFR